MKVIEGNVASPLGFSADGLHAGFKKRKLDFGWIVSEVPASVAGVYTTNKVIAAPLIVTRQSVKKAQKMKAIVVNSGIANSCTGVQGMEDAYTIQKWTAEKLGVEPDLVGVASTGVIGDLLPMDTLKTGLSKLVVNGNSDDFSKAILTTDTMVKTVAVTEKFGRDEVTMAGVAKGAGMIHPNMATMLAFITCDANISSETLQLALSQNVETTFNQITVDGDTSTNDMVLVMSNGCTLNEEIFGEDPNWGRILAAVGYAGVDVPVDNIDIFLGDVPVMLKSSPVEFEAEEIQYVMHEDEITITVDLHAGEAQGKAWGCDLSYSYVKINALYRT